MLRNLCRLVKPRKTSERDSASVTSRDKTVFTKVSGKMIRGMGSAGKSGGILSAILVTGGII